MAERLRSLGVKLRMEGAEVADFGDPAREHAHLIDSVAVLVGVPRHVLRVSGARARRMLDGLCTNAIQEASGRAVYTFILTPKGRPVAEGRVLDMGDAVWLDVPLPCRSGLDAHLERYLNPRLAARRPANRIRVGLVGPAWTAAWEEVGGPPDLAAAEPLSQGTWRGVGSSGPIPVVRREPIEGPGIDLYLDPADLADIWPTLSAAARRAGGGPAGGTAFRIHRVELGLPVYGEDISEENLPQETGQTGRAVSFDKGCYTGQEVIARIHYRGRVNRHLRGLLLPVPDVPAALYRDGRSVGTVTTVANSPRFGPVALAYVRREVEPGERLATDPGSPETVEVVALPFADA